MKDDTFSKVVPTNRELAEMMQELQRRVRNLESLMQRRK